MPRCLITGLTGFVGSHLADYLLKETDWEIWGMARWDDNLSNIQHLIPEINKDQRLHLTYADLTDTVSIYDMMKHVCPDYVFHLAAQSYPMTSFKAPENTIDVNTQGTLRILEACREYAREAWIHVCSSSEVYGRVTKEFLPITEDCPFSPASPYSISKVGADLLGQHYAKAYGMKVLVTRMFTHTGARRGDVFAESSFAKQIAMIEAGKQEPLIHVGNLKSMRTIADVRDAVRAYHMLLTVNPQKGEIYNIGGEHSCTVRDVLDKLMDLSGNQYMAVTDENRLRPIDADLQVPDCSKFKTHTGWEPQYSFDETMQALLDYWREQVKTGEFLLR